MFNSKIGKQLAIALSATVVGTAAFAELPESFADLAEEVSPAVVRITTTTTIPGGNALDSLPNNQELPGFLKEFFQNVPEFQTPERQAEGLGSGFLIDGGKFIVTNNHVIGNSDQIRVETINGENIEAELIGRDAGIDIAVLKVTSDLKLPSVEFGDSDEARVGDWVMAVGNPLGQDFSVTTGIVSARHRSLDGPYDDFIQTDAAINRGNSGGPLFNMEGEVIGVNTAIISPTGGSVGLGFSMASSVVENVVDQIIEFGSAQRGWLGIVPEPVNDLRAEAMGLKDTKGALVSEVVPDSPAAKAGLKAGDVILKFGGETIDDFKEIFKIVANSQIDKDVSMEVYRPSDNKNINLKVKLGARPQDEQIASNDANPAKPLTSSENLLGMKLSPVDTATAEAMGLDVERGLLINEVDPASHAGKRGLRAGDVILEVNQREVNTVEDFNQSLESAEKSKRTAIMLLVARGNNAVFIALPLEEK